MSAVEAMSHVDEMVTVYEGEPLETENLAHVTDMVIRNLDSHIEEGERIKAVIKAFVCDFEEEQAMSQRIRENCYVDVEVMQVESASQTAQKEKSTLSSEISDIHGKRQQLISQVDEVKARNREALAALRQGDLYNSVAQIRWQKDPENNTLVKGTVVNKSGVKPFSLDPSQQSRNFVCNYVWNLLEPDW